MIWGGVWLLSANAAVILAAATIARRFSTGIAPLDAVILLLVRLLLISVSVLLAGLGGGLRASVLGPLGLAFLGALLCLGCHRRMRLPDLSQVHPVLIAFAGLIALRLGLQVFFFAPHLGDALCYHLPKVAEWIRAGAFTREMGLHPHVTFPAGFELIEAWWVVFLHHDVLIEAAGVEFLVLSAVSTFALARYVGVSANGSMLAALIDSLSPGLHLSATSCLNDAATAGLVVATAAIVAWRGPAWALGVALGLGLGVKATFLYAIPGLGLLAWRLRREPAPAPPRGWPPWLLAAGAWAAGSFWYVRNLAWYGNPVFPVGAPEYGRDLVAVQTGPRWSSLLGSLSDLINARIYDHQGPLGANVDDMAGWGAGAFAVGLVALGLGMRREPRLRELGFAFLASLAGCLLLCSHDPWCLKYVFFFPAVLAASAAWLCQSQPGVLRLATLCLAADFLFTLLPYDLPIEDFGALARQPWRGRSMLPIKEPALSSARVGCFGGFQARSYLLYGADFGREVVYLRANSFSELLEAMRRRDLETLYAWPGGEEQAAVLNEGLRTGKLVQIGARLFQRAPG